MPPIDAGVTITPHATVAHLIRLIRSHPSNASHAALRGRRYLATAPPDDPDDGSMASAVFFRLTTQERPDDRPIVFDPNEPEQTHLRLHPIGNPLGPSGPSLCQKPAPESGWRLAPPGTALTCVECRRLSGRTAGGA